MLDCQPSSFVWLISHDYLCREVKIYELIYELIYNYLYLSAIYVYYFQHKVKNKQVTLSGAKRSLVSDILRRDVLERNVYGRFPSSHPRRGEGIVIRGAYPTIPTHFSSVRRSVRNKGFTNLTRITVPTNVEYFLSQGPKYMLPCLTLTHSIEQGMWWERMIDELAKAGYCLLSQFGFLSEVLRSEYLKHLGEGDHLSFNDIHMLLDGMATNRFLSSNYKHVLVVEADKGKKMCLVYRSQYAKLCDAFLDKGVRDLRYKRVFIENESTFIKQVQDLYLTMVSCYTCSIYDLTYEDRRLFRVLPNESNRSHIEEVERMNTYTGRLLRNLKWNFPVFLPSLKIKPSELKIRPLMRKRNTPSIGVGNAINYTLEKIM